jgi:UDP-N-acetylglucosamine diphosphorylase / glucose-1-phosphate thymidylyltransferase / UDP-N-acetylgalactosamine diphosphorylase / glucosamine-1-phosphate N-acetyltransferase / galactosamine-1-phosphate N-acetyltransferase
MSELSIFLFDDATARDWQPFALTRPVGELMFGAFTFRERAERLFAARCAGHIAAPHLIGFDEDGAAPVVSAGDRLLDGARLFLSSRALVDWGARLDPADGPALVTVGGEVAGWYAPAGSAGPEPGWFEAPAGLPGTGTVELPGRMLRRVWDLVSGNPRQVVTDFEAAADGAVGTETAAAGEDAVRNGPIAAVGYRAGMLRLGAGVRLEPHVVLDFSDGPIELQDGVTVQSFTRIAGPAYIGPATALLGGPLNAVSIGPGCKVHGELEESVILGYSNKAHDGFLGHAYLGRWVNLGAMTTNSDLKNNYGTIRMWTPDGETDTGLMKLGCLLGDHVKTGIGALLNTGTVIGAGSNTYGSEMPPKFVPPFSWGSGAELVAFEADKFLETAATVMQRRDVTLSAAMRRVLLDAWRIGREQA